MPKGWFGGGGGFTPSSQNPAFWWIPRVFISLFEGDLCDMLSYFILIIIAGSKYKCDSLMEDKKYL